MEEELKQEFKTKELKKLISWEGWKKELGWVLFFTLLLFAAYSYNRDISLCRPYLEDPCSKCQERDTAKIDMLKQQVVYLEDKINLDKYNLNITLFNDG